MKYKNVLLLYKKSSYKIYFENKESSFHSRNFRLLKQEIKKFKASHDEHYTTLDYVRRLLKKYHVNYAEYYRGRNIDYGAYDLIITIGGDGTFLEASRKVTHQTILGVNSAPTFSVGRYCAVNKNTFEAKLKNIIADRYKAKKLHRLNVSFEGSDETFLVLNDVLVCHASPAALFRYRIQINGQEEEQRSSGLWVSTASGSSGAMKSAGGKSLNPHSDKFQYMPRELHQGLAPRYQLKGGVLTANKSIKLTTMVRRGQIFADGAHHRKQLQYGETIMIKRSSKPIKTIIL